MSPVPDPIPQGITREEMRDLAAEKNVIILDKLNDILDKCNDIFEKVDK